MSLAPNSTHIIVRYSLKEYMILYPYLVKPMSQFRNLFMLAPFDHITLSSGHANMVVLRLIAKI